MDLIADFFLIGGAVGVAFYCFVLSRRLTRFTDLKRGVGGAVAVLSAQVDDLKRALDAAKRAADGSGDTLREVTERADNVARRLELAMAALHDVDDTPPEPVFARREPQQSAAPVAATAVAPAPVAPAPVPPAQVEPSQVAARFATAQVAPLSATRTRNSVSAQPLFSHRTAVR